MYAEYAYYYYYNMRNNCNITVKAIIAKINNKAYYNNSVKTTTFALKNNSSNTG
jgi:hypothetical protein